MNEIKCARDRPQIHIYENHDLAIPALRVAFDYLNASSQCSVALIYIFKYPHTGQWH